MKVNASKTAMVCVSGAQSYHARAYIEEAGGSRVESGGGAKVLGFHFSSKPSAHAHVEAICKRMRCKFWVLFHLKKAGFSDSELARVYRRTLTDNLT